MVKILVSALAVMAMMSSTALACDRHSKGGKGPATTAVVPAVVVIAKTAQA